MEFKRDYFFIENKNTGAILCGICLTTDPEYDAVTVESNCFVKNIIDYLDYIRPDTDAHNINRELLVSYFDKFQNIDEWYAEYYKKHYSYTKNDDVWYKMIYDYIKSDLYLFCSAADATTAYINNAKNIIK